jgi:hypothetical protein
MSIKDCGTESNKKLGAISHGKQVPKKVWKKVKKSVDKGATGVLY